MKTLFISTSKANPLELVAKYSRWIKANEAKLKTTPRGTIRKELQAKIDKQRKLLAKAKMEAKKTTPVPIKKSPVKHNPGWGGGPGTDAVRTSSTPVHAGPRKFNPDGTQLRLGPVGVNGRRR